MELDIKNITDAAKKQVEELCKLEKAGSFLRIEVKGGGCSGFEYKFDFDSKIDTTDNVYEWTAGKVVIDDLSIQYMKGFVLDFSKDFGGERFFINNPLSGSSCGCGISFSIKDELM